MTKADWTGPDNQTAPRTLLMGTDSFGRDIHSRVLYGTRISSWWASLSRWWR